MLGHRPACDQHCLRGPGVDRPTWQTVDQEPVADDIVPLGDRADDLDHDLSAMIAVLARSRISSVQLLEQSLLWLVELLPQSQFCGYAPGSARQARRASQSAAGLLSCVVGAPGPTRSPRYCAEPRSREGGIEPRVPVSGEGAQWHWSDGTSHTYWPDTLASPESRCEVSTSADDCVSSVASVSRKKMRVPQAGDCESGDRERQPSEAGSERPNCA